MKFENQKAFENHIASLRSIETLFVVIVPEEKERRDIAFRIKNIVLGRAGNFEVQSFTCGSHPVEDIVSAFHSMSLFSQKQVIEIHDMHALNQSDLKLIYQEAKRSAGGVVTLFFSQKGLPQLSRYIKGALVLDLSKEKPWDHKKRVMSLLFEYVKKANKAISHEAIEQLVDLIGIDYGRLLQQVESLICYVGDRQEIKVQDLQSLNISKKKQKTWQLAEYLTWGEGVGFPLDGITDADFYPLLMQVRSRLHVGMKIKEGIEPEGIAPRLMQKYLSYSQSLDKGYFQEAFGVVYEIERLSRSGQFSTSFLFDMLYVKLYDLRESNRCFPVSPS